MYYVYEWFVVETGFVFYVGKGKGRRYKVKSQRNSAFTEMLKNNECDSRILRWFDNERDAFEFEYEYIKKMKELGQCTCNLHSGGAGGSGDYWTDELRKEYSENNVAKTQEQRKRMSEKNPMKNPETALRVNSLKRRPVIIGDDEFVSIIEAATQLNVATDTIYTWCKKGINSKGELCRFKDSEQVIFSDKRYNKGSSKSVVFRGVRYESVMDFAKENNIGQNTACAWLKRGFNPKGEPCVFENDDRELLFKNRYKESALLRRKSISINNIKYDSVDAASKILKIPKSTLYSYLNGNRQNDKFVCAYI